MVHPDEGTIHAWLDGALAPDEALRIEAHVQSCETCGPAVAEARGFVAASSRILSALDDVPSAVIPAEVHARPAVAHIRMADEQRKRRFRQTFSMAATLMLMLSGGLFVVNQTSRNAAQLTDTAALGERIADAARSEVAMDSTALPAVAANVPSPAEARTDAPPTVSAPAGAQSPAGAGASRAGTEGNMSAGKASTTNSVTSGAQADVAATVASAPPTLPVTPPTAAEARTTGAVGNVAGGAAATQQVAQRDVRAQDSAARAEQMQRGAAFRNAAGAPAAAPPPAATSPTAPANPGPLVAATTGCYQIASQGDLSIADSRRDEAMVVAALPARIRLTDSAVVNASGERRYLARSIIAGGTPVRRFAWSVAPNGALRLFVGDSANAPAVRVAADTAAVSGAAARLRKISCGN